MRRKCGKSPEVLGFWRFAIVRCFSRKRSAGMAANDMTAIIASLRLAICVVTVTV